MYLSALQGYTALHVAAAASAAVVVAALLAGGASTHARSKRGHTPLDLALAATPCAAQEHTVSLLRRAHSS